MKKKVLIIGIILILAISLVLLTGCGASSNITDTLNNVVSEELAEWQEEGYARSFTMYLIQEALDSKEVGYVIVASGESAFTASPGITEYEEGDVPNYGDSSYSYTRMMEGESAAKNAVIYDSNSGKYYNVEITYEKTELRGVERQYPVFSNATEIK